MKKEFPLLQAINSPQDVRALPIEQLEPLCEELRSYLLESVAGTGGHLSSNLGTVELTVALHHVFDTPNDRIVWDVGHQTYPHKILTGRRERMKTLRQLGGLSGFPQRRERIRFFWYRALEHVHFCSAGHGAGQPHQGGGPACDCGHWRRRDDWRDGV